MTTKKSVHDDGIKVNKELYFRMSAGLLSKWMGHPNVANMHRRAPMARGRMQGYDIEDDSSEFVDQFPGNNIFKTNVRSGTIGGLIRRQNFFQIMTACHSSNVSILK